MTAAKLGSMPDALYAHTAEGRPWQKLREHLENVAELCAGFAAAFDSAEVGRLVGLLHDLGKEDPAFQRYLKGDGQGCPHAYAGARWLFDAYRDLGKLLAYPVAGHHAGLPDAQGDARSLDAHLAVQKSPREPFRERPADAAALARLFPVFLHGRPKSVHLWIRMLFSALTDADWLDTEAFMDPARASARGHAVGTVADLLERYTASMRRLNEGRRETAVNRLRADILRDALEKAAQPRGVFSLTVPTGGGKTLSSLGFALHHAARHGLKRVIYVIPYTSIIEQTAEVFSDVLGGENVLEHHGEAKWRDEDGPCATACQLASENWEGFPVIVCTSVQFFESFYASKPSRCRKLHNVAGSVIIFDETQKLPERFVAPCADLIARLCAEYGCTAVLCTATQPDLSRFGLDRVTEIVRDPGALYEGLRRTEIHDLGAMPDWAAVAREMLAKPSALCVVNTRRDAQELFRELEGLADGGRGSVFHLSTWMCPQHRRDVLEVIRGRLARGEAVYAVATSLIEAGVDVDFPTAFRARAGLDSIAQVAGRCNREGRLETGHVYVFDSPAGGADETVGKAIQAGERVPGTLNEKLSRPETFRTYFQQFYAACNERGERILKMLSDPGSLRFREASDAFVFIPDRGETDVFVPYGEGETLTEEAIRNGLDRHLLRRLRRYAVSLLPRQTESLREALVPLRMYDGSPSPYAALCPGSGFYRESIGIATGAEPGIADEALII